MKLKITQIPFKHDYQLEPMQSPSTMAEEDYHIIKKLMQEGKEEEVNDFVNKRLLNAELQFTENDQSPDEKEGSAGMATKRYVHDIIGRNILEDNPTVERYLSGGRIKQAANELVNTLHPNYEAYRDRAHKKGPIIDKIRKLIFGGYNSNIDHNSEMPDENLLGYFHPQEGVKMSVRQSPASYASTLKHEMDHALDFVAKTLSEDEDFIKEYPKYKNLKKDSFKGKAETGYVNPIIPNFEDYNFQKGEFESNYVRDPVDITKEIMGNHRYGREHLFDELRKKLK